MRPSSALNMTLPAFAAECRRPQHSARSKPTAIDRYLLPAGRSAANPPAAVDQQDRETDRRPTVAQTLLHILCKQRQCNEGGKANFEASIRETQRNVISTINSRHTRHSRPAGGLERERDAILTCARKPT